MNLHVFYCVELRKISHELIYLKFIYSFILADDASSGYDSTESSDNESVTSQDSRPSNREQNRTCAVVAEVLKVRSTHALSEDLRLIMSLPEMCDVTFLVGPSKIEVHGVKSILAMRSR